MRRFSHRGLVAALTTVGLAAGLSTVTGWAATANVSLSTVPASSFANVHVALTPALGTAAVSAESAMATAGQFAVDGKVLETTFAHCAYSALPPGAPIPVLPNGQKVDVYSFDRDCWVVSLSAAGLSPIGPPPPVGAPAGAPAPATTPYAYNVALIDGVNGNVLMAFRDGAAPNAKGAQAPAPVRVRAEKLSLALTPSRLRKPPYRLTVSGRLFPGHNIAPTTGCRGRVVVRASRPNTGPAGQSVALGGGCVFRVGFVLKRGGGGARYRVTVSARFLGNAVLLPATAGRVSALVG